MPWHHLFFATYEWLVNQNLWKAAVNWVVAGILATVFIRRPWRKHRAAQNKISDQLSTSTPGGLTDVNETLTKILNSLEKSSIPPDNDSSPSE